MALSFDDFKKNLKDGKYESLAGARRAIGKAQAFSDGERESAKKLVDKHFGAESAPAPKASKKTAEKKAAKKETKPAKTAAAAPSKRQPRTSSKGEAVEGISAELLSAGPVNLDDLSSITAQMHIANTAVDKATLAMNSCSSIGIDKDSDEMKEQRGVLSSAIKLLRSVTDRANGVAGKISVRQPKTAATGETVETSPANGSPKTAAEKLFEGSRPEAAAEA